MNLHDEFLANFVDLKQGDGLEAGPGMNQFIYTNQYEMFFALRAWVIRKAAKAAAVTALDNARTALTAAIDAINEKPPT